MKRIFLTLFLILILSLVGFTKDTEEQTTVQKNSFQFKPELFLQFPLSAVIINPKTSDGECGLALFGVDATVFKRGRWNFVGIGGGVASYIKKLDEPYYDDIFLFYLKLIPIKYHLCKQIYAEVSITTEKMIVFSLTVNLSAFKKNLKKIVSKEIISSGHRKWPLLKHEFLTFILKYSKISGLEFTVVLCKKFL